MQIALIHVPLWSVDTPCYGLCLVQAMLRSLGHETRYFELEIDLYHACGKDDKMFWESQHGHLWDDAYCGAAYVLLIKYQSFIEEYAQRVAEFSPDVIAYSMNQRSLGMVLGLQKIFKCMLPDAISIAGGPYCFDKGCSAELLKTSLIDWVCTCDAERGLAGFLEGSFFSVYNSPPRGWMCVVDGEVKWAPIGESLRSTDMSHWADFWDIDFTKYKEPNNFPISMSRGCINKCAFCSERSYNRNYYIRDPEDVAEEILFHIEHTNVGSPHYILFNDSLVNGDIYRLERLSNKLTEISTPLGYGGMAMVRSEMEPVFLKKLARSGCYKLQYGIESGSNAVLMRMGKKHSSEMAAKVLRATFESGIRADVFLIVGFPGETQHDFLDTLEFIRNNQTYIDNLYVNTCMILPNSELGRNPTAYGLRVSDPHHWQLQDGTNTFEIRLERKAVLLDAFQN
jgi:anaerobic magnesium-protoporphyrin IX monomethyl ester cyclase